MTFVSEWLAYAQDRRAIADDDNVLDSINDPDFCGHRHDQTILSLVAKKWNLDGANQKNDLIQPFLIIDHSGDFKDICVRWLVMELNSFKLVFGIMRFIVKYYL